MNIRNFFNFRQINLILMWVLVILSLLSMVLTLIDLGYNNDWSLNVEGVVNVADAFLVYDGLYTLTLAFVAIYYAKKQLEDSRDFALKQLEESRMASEQAAAQFGKHVRDSFSLSVANPRVRFLHDIIDDAKVNNRHLYRYISLYTTNLILNSLLQLKPIVDLRSLQTAIDECFDILTSVYIELGSGIYASTCSISSKDIPYSSKLVFRFIETLYDCNGFDDPSYNSCEDAFSDLFLQMCKQHEGFDEIYTMGIKNDKEEKEKVARKNAIVDQIIKDLDPNFDKNVRKLIRHNRYFPR